MAGQAGVGVDAPLWQRGEATGFPGDRYGHVVTEVQAIVDRNLPGYAVETVVLIGEGQDNLAYEVNGELIVRVSRRGAVAREARLLAAVAKFSPLPIPEPVFTAGNYLAYRKLPGTPLIDLPWPPSGTVLPALVDLLTVLHAVPEERLTGLVDVDDDPLTAWRDETAATYRSLAGELPAPFRAALEAFLAAPPPGEPPVRVFSHNDLGIEHVLVEPDTGAVTGVIDWSDAAITDPAYDYGLLYRDLGPAALPREPGLRERAVFYGRCAVVEDLAYGLESAREKYVTKCLRSLPWLFGP